MWQPHDACAVASRTCKPQTLNEWCAPQLEDVQRRAEAAEAALQEERNTHKRAAEAQEQGAG